MRIVAGEFGSRPIKSVKGDSTRPTADKVKGAVFSSLGNTFHSGRFLDCYSGTGNMALEALSRGMDTAVMVDKNRQAILTIKENVHSLGVEKRCKVIQKDIFSALSSLKEPFDVVYIDPPYKLQKNEALMEALDYANLLNPGCIVVVESTSQESWPDQVASLKKYKEKDYRNTKITYYRKETE